MNMAAIYPTSSVSGGEISRLLTAAVVNQRFCRLLLTNPQRALDTGYNGEAFRLANDEKDRILAIQARSLTEFAMQLTGSPSRAGYRRDHRLNRNAGRH